MPTPEEVLAAEAPCAVVPGDCLDTLRAMPDNSVDAVVTDPPFAISFMGAVWDTFQAADVPMRRRADIDAVNAGASRQGGRQRACVDYQRRQAADMRAFQAWCEEWSAEALRVAKPGAHMLAFGGTRTFHRMVCGIEDAGWEIRDVLLWVFGCLLPANSPSSETTHEPRPRQPESHHR